MQPFAGHLRDVGAVSRPAPLLFLSFTMDNMRTQLFMFNLNPAVKRNGSFATLASRFTNTMHSIAHRPMNGAATARSGFNALISPDSRSTMQMTQRGFTLIEIMVVVVIMGILAALVAPKLMGRTDDARMIAARQDIATIMQGLKLYRLDNQRYPITEQGLQALITKPVTGPDANGWKTGGYLEKVPKDPWGNPYQYLSPGIKGEIDVFSLGADGQPGGDGNDADIGSWEL